MILCHFYLGKFQKQMVTHHLLMDLNKMMAELHRLLMVNSKTQAGIHEIIGKQSR